MPGTLPGILFLILIQFIRSASYRDAKRPDSTLVKVYVVTRVK